MPQPFFLRRLIVLPCLAAVLVVAGCEAVSPAPQAKIVFTPEAARTAAPSGTDVAASPPPPPEAPPPIPGAGAQPGIQTESLPPVQAPPTAPPTGAAVSQPTQPPLPSVQPAAADGSRGVRVALLVPLTGTNAALGAMLSNAVQLALFDTGDDRLELQPIDTKGTPQGAAAAVQAAIQQGADVVLGPVFSADVKAVASLAQARGLPVLSFTTDRSAVGQGIYTLGLLPSSQAEQVLSAVKAEGRTRIAVLAPDTEFGHAMADAAQAAVQSQGLTLSKMQFYPPTQTDFRLLAQSFADYAGRKALVDREKNLLAGGGDAAKASASMPFDAVFLPDEGLRLKNLVSLLTYYGIDPGPVRFLGTMRWEDRTVSDEPMLQGAWYAAPSQAALDVFEDHYTKTFGPVPKPLVSLAGEAYDGLALVALLDQKGGGLPPAQRLSQDRLTDSQGYAGVVGLFRLKADGTNERGLSVRQVTQGGNTEAVAAPQRFAATDAATH